jgi:hypothetical protein
MAVATSFVAERRKLPPNARAAAQRDALAKIRRRQQRKQAQHERHLEAVWAQCGGRPHLRIKAQTPAFAHVTPTLDSARPGVVTVLPVSARPDTYGRTSRHLETDRPWANHYVYADRLNAQDALVERVIFDPLLHEASDIREPTRDPYDRGGLGA